MDAAVDDAVGLEMLGPDLPLGYHLVGRRLGEADAHGLVPAFGAGVEDIGDIEDVGHGPNRRGEARLDPRKAEAGP